MTLRRQRSSQREEWLSRAEFENLIRPQVAETVEALRSAGEGVGPDTPVPATVAATGFAGSDVPEPAQTEVPHRPSPTTIPLDVEPADVQQRRARSRRFKRFAAAGTLALVGGAASVPLITSHSDSISPASAETPAPPAAIPASDDGSDDNGPRSDDSAGAPAPTPNEQADGPAPARSATAPVPHTRNDNRATSPASLMPPSPQRGPAIPIEAYARSHMAARGANDQHASDQRASDQHQTRPRPEPPPHPPQYPHRGD